MTTINSYLTFNGTCEEAFNFYKSVFGGDFLSVSKFKDMPPSPDYPIPEADKDKIMHVSLPISKETILMGSDTSEAFGEDIIQGNNFSLSVNTDTVEEVDQIFNALSQGGKVKMPASKTFWGAYFGTLTDRYGINWMVSCELPEHKS